MLLSFTVAGTPDLARHFLAHVASAQPLFGSACELEERHRWNRVQAKFGINSMEAGLAAILDGTSPGPYWLTLLPTILAERNQISLSTLAGVALDHVELYGGQHLFRFYDTPRDWRRAGPVVDLRASSPSIFNVETVKRQLANATTFQEVNAVMRAWP